MNTTTVTIILIKLKVVFQKIQTVTNQKELEDAYSVRKIVFVEEQAVPLEEQRHAHPALQSDGRHVHSGDGGDAGQPVAPPARALEGVRQGGAQQLA